MKMITTFGLDSAAALGAAMRLGCDLSGRSPALFAGVSLAADGGDLVLSFRAGSARLIGETVEKRFNTLADLLGLTPRIDIP